MIEKKKMSSAIILKFMRTKNKHFGSCLLEKRKKIYFN